jgi:hypothetical protein
MKLERYTQKAWGTYPRCQHVENGVQCSKTSYGDGVCWVHYAPKVPPRPLKERESSNPSPPLEK